MTDSENNPENPSAESKLGFRPQFLLLFPLAIVVGLILKSYLTPEAQAYPKETAPFAVEFTQSSPDQWINSAPLKLADFRGKVVLLDFWTFDCYNCYRSIPWLNGVEDKYRDAGLQVIGIHTPEFAHEKVAANVLAKVQEFDIKHPVMLDNDFQYWNAMGNRYWPAWYLIDQQGRVRAVHVGETHANTAGSRKIEADIELLLAESAARAVP